jgi:hypothetical protein
LKPICMTFSSCGRTISHIPQAILGAGMVPKEQS